MLYTRGDICLDVEAVLYIKQDGTIRFKDGTLLTGSPAFIAAWFRDPTKPSATDATKENVRPKKRP